MNKIEFGNHLLGITEKTIEFCKKKSIKNYFSENVKYKIRPNQIEDSPHLDSFEKKILTVQIRELNQCFTISEVVDKLFIDNKFPVWINVSIDKTTKCETTIELLTSRRFRDELTMHIKEGFSPFHMAIPAPPYVNSDEKFDLNWKHQKLKTFILKEIYWKIYNFKKIFTKKKCQKTTYNSSNF